MLYWNLEGRNRRELDNLRDNVEKNISSMLWLVNEDERRNDREKIFMMSCQLEQLQCDVHRMAMIAEMILAGEDNNFFTGREKEEIKYYN